MTESFRALIESADLSEEARSLWETVANMSEEELLLYWTALRELPYGDEELRQAVTTRIASENTKTWKPR